MPRANWPAAPRPRQAAARAGRAGPNSAWPAHRQPCRGSPRTRSRRAEMPLDPDEHAAAEIGLRPKVRIRAAAVPSGERMEPGAALPKCGGAALLTAQYVGGADGSSRRASMRADHSSHHLNDFMRCDGDLTRRVGPGLVEQPGQALGGEAAPPFRDHVGVRSDPGAQIALFSSPAAAASTIRALRAIACPARWARASDSSSCCSGAVSSIATAA